MAVPRSPEMVLVGYFLARCGRVGQSGTLPPAQLSTDQWNRAYAAFFRELGGGRTLQSFSNSLKNARDLFDSYVDSGRVGWRQADGERAPLPLTSEAQLVFDRWNHRDAGEVWDAVSQFADLGASQVTATVLADALAELGLNEAFRLRTEGGRQVVISTRIERDPRLRHDAIHLHGTSCFVCGFNYGEIYGDWGGGFVEVHHLQPIASDGGNRRVTDPNVDLAVLCANCHRMVHRRRGIVLTLDELKSKIDAKALCTWVSSLTSKLSQRAV